jgi:hypothetical protein
MSDSVCAHTRPRKLVAFFAAEARAEPAKHTFVRPPIDHDRARFMSWTDSARRSSARRDSFKSPSEQNRCKQKSEKILTFFSASKKVNRGVTGWFRTSRDNEPRMAHRDDRKPPSSRVIHRSGGAAWIVRTPNQRRNA